jgi:hypothetical protein
MAMKSAGNFTPGPWRNEMGDIYATIEECDYLIADASGDNDLGIEEAEANAELIAAAPEFLVLLQAAFHALRSYQHGNPTPDVAKKIAALIEPVVARHAGGHDG